MKKVIGIVALVVIIAVGVVGCKVLVNTTEPVVQPVTQPTVVKVVAPTNVVAVKADTDAPAKK